MALSIETFGSSIVAIVGGAVVFDRILLTKQKTALHSCMIAMWCRIADLRPPELATSAASSCLNVFHKLFRWPLFSIQTLTLAIAVSYVATTAAWNIGRLWEGLPPTLSDGLPFYPIYLVNFVCDLLTVLCGVVCLKVIKNGGWIKTVFSVLANVAVAGLLANIAFVGSIYIGAYSTYNNWPGAERFVIEPAARQLQAKIEHLTHEGAAAAAASLPDLKAYVRRRSEPVPVLEALGFWMTSPFEMFVDPISEGPASSSEHRILTVTNDTQGTSHRYILTIDYINGWPLFLTATNTFLPTILFAILFTWMSFAKGMLWMSQRLTLHFLERSTENDPSKDPKTFVPFTLFAGTFSLFISFMKFIFWLVTTALAKINSSP